MIRPWSRRSLERISSILIERFRADLQACREPPVTQLRHAWFYKHGFNLVRKAEFARMLLLEPLTIIFSRVQHKQLTTPILLEVARDRHLSR